MIFKKIKDKLFTKKDQKYSHGFNKSRTSLVSKIKALASKYREIDDDYFEQLETILIMADVGVKMAVQIVAEIKVEVKKHGIKNPKLINELIVDKMFTIYAGNSIISTNLNIEENRLNVILVVGVNGSGKTTTIAKIAHNLQAQNKKIMLVAGDTFRAGAVLQLEQWGQRLNIEVISPEKAGQDPASVIFKGLVKAKTQNVDVIICDTAGRLQTKINLMNELNKLYKVIQKEVPEGPHETLLVLDATTGQNGISQAQNFTQVAPISGIVLTKMDGTSKGGIILAIKEYLKIPVKLIGLGEKVDDLQEFDLDNYIYSLTSGLIDNRE